MNTILIIAVAALVLVVVARCLWPVFIRKTDEYIEAGYKELERRGTYVRDGKRPRP